jgi:hypothetical protein
MAKNRSGHRPGGGIASRQHVEKPIRQGASRERINLLRKIVPRTLRK